MKQEDLQEGQWEVMVLCEVAMAMKKPKINCNAILDTVHNRVRKKAGRNPESKASNAFL